jgi:hypothetical protein
MKKRRAHCETWNMVRNIKKSFKMRNAYCRSWNMGRNLKNVENEIEIFYDLKLARNPEYLGK